MRKLSLCCACFWLALANFSLGAEPDDRISQYGHASWRIQDGVLAGSPTAVTQTKDGYIWVATRSGLQRFDGTKFTLFSPPAGQEGVRSPRIISVLAAHDGTLWIGTSADIEHWDGRRLVHYPTAAGLIFGRVMHMIEDRTGSIWFVRAGSADMGGPLCKIARDKLICFGESDGLPFRFSNSLVEDPSGDLWVSSGDRLFRWNPQATVQIPVGVPGNAVADSIQSMIIDASGSLMVGAEQSSRGFGLGIMHDGRLIPYQAPGLNGRQLGVQSLFMDSHGALWIGTLSEGIWRVSTKRVEHFRMMDGLTSDTVNGFFEDAEGNIWISTSQGLDRFRTLRVVSLSTHEGLAADSAGSVVAASGGALWISNWKSLDRLENGVITSFTYGSGLPGEEVTSIFEDHTHRLWVGIDHGLAYMDSKGKFTRVYRSGGKDLGVVQAVSETAAGDLWMLLSDPATIVRLHNQKIVEEIPRSRMKFAITAALAADQSDGFWVATYEGNIAHWHNGAYELVDFGRPAHTAQVDQLAVLADGSVVGASGAGLVGWHEGRPLTLTTSNGLPCSHIWSMQQDTRQDLWMYSECGLLRLEKAEIYKWFADPSHRPDFLRLDTWDGVQPARSIWSPQSALGPDGTLYFANSSVIQMFNPERSAPALPTPAAHIESVLADRKAYSLNEELSLPPRTGDVQIDYTAPSFAVPEKVQFRYRLIGHDQEWVSAGTRRQAVYSQLSPGRYRFEVSAANQEGHWGDKVAALVISVAPAFYQTKAFIVLSVVAVLGMLWLGYILRFRSIRARMQGRLDAALMERERIAHDLHDTFFQSIQGLLLRFNTGTTSLSELDPARAIFVEALEKSDAVMHEGRKLVFELRPESPQSSLGEALENFAKGRGLGCQTQVDFECTGAPLPIQPMVFEELLRIGREALANAFQHAKAARIVVETRYEINALSLLIKDNGTGVDATVLEGGHRPYHYGVPGMRERTLKMSGRFTIGRTSEWSTEVHIRVPAGVAYQVRRGFLRRMAEPRL